VNIGLDLRLFGYQHGGIGRYCRELFPRILEMDKENRYFLFVNEKEVALLTDILKSINSNAQIIPCNIRHYSLSEQLSFYKVLNKYNLDLVHFPNFNVPILYKKPFVVTIHDMVHHKIGGAKKSHYFHFLAYKKVIANAAEKSREIITVSQTSKKDIASFLQVDPNKIKVIYEGSSLNSQVDEKLVEKVKKSYLITRPYFLFVGVLERKKNLVNLTRGFDYFLEKYKAGMDMVIVGKSDPHYPEIKHHALDIKNSGRLIFTGQVEDWELRALYKGAYAFVSASLHEGFGLPGVEALGFGLPLLVSNTPVFNEIYDNSAIYFNPLDPEDIGEKMNILARDNLFHQQLQEKSFERSQLFDWKKAAKETLQVYGLPEAAKSL
jgi:glycosyltransferase involved in cell wall biosynthesis